MKILEIRALRGPNYYSQFPIIYLKLDIGKLENKPTDKIPGFKDCLLKLLPTLSEHRCSPGHPGGFIKRIERGTWMGHVTEHVAIELQCLASMEVGFGKTLDTDVQGVYDIVFRYRDEKAGIKAGREAVGIVNSIYKNKHVDINKIILKLKKIREANLLGPSTKSIVDEAKKRDIPIIQLNTDSYVQLGHGVNQRRIQATIMDNTSAIGVEIADDKKSTKDLLAQAGIPVPVGEVVTKLTDAYKVAKNIGYPIVVKPLVGNHGRGISVNITNEKDLKKAFTLTDTQTSAILEIRLRQLARLEEVRLKAEQKELETEKEKLEELLGNESAFKEYIKEEIRSDSKKYGDKRRSPVKERKEAEKLSLMDLMETEPVSIILSQNGWIRSAKGHDINPATVKFLSGDSLLSCLRIMSDKAIVFLDDSGRSYTLYSHLLPSARGNGEPLTRHLALQPNTQIQHMLSDENERHYLIGSDHSYGFIVKFEDLLSSFKNGKAVISLKNTHNILKPDGINDIKTDMALAVTNMGRILVFPLKQLPYLKKGQGNKIIAIPQKDRTASSPELLKNLKILPEQSDILIYSGKHKLNLSPGNWKDYCGMRGQRGKKLPKPFTVIDRIEIIKKDK